MTPYDDDILDDDTGFENFSTLVEQDQQEIDSTMDLRDQLNSLLQHPGYKFIIKRLDDLKENFLHILKKSDNFKDIRKCQAIIYVFEQFSGIIEEVILEADKLESQVNQNIESALLGG